MGFPFMALAAHINGYVLLGHEQEIVSAVRGVTTAASALADGFAKMLVLGIGDGPLLQFNGIGVTLPANFRLRPVEQLGCFAAMRVVAVQTAGGVRQRPVDLFFGVYLIDHGLMALQTQGRTLFLDFQCIGRRRAVVALLAFLFGHRCMHRRVENIAFVGAMRIVAGVAVAVVHLVIHVPSGKCRSVGFMALRAYFGSLVFQ